MTTGRINQVTALALRPPRPAGRPWGRELCRTPLRPSPLLSQPNPTQSHLAHPRRTTGRRPRLAVPALSRPPPRPPAGTGWTRSSLRQQLSAVRPNGATALQPDPLHDETGGPCGLARSFVALSGFRSATDRGRDGPPETPAAPRTQRRQRRVCVPVATPGGDPPQPSAHAGL